MIKYLKKKFNFIIIYMIKCLIKKNRIFNEFLINLTVKIWWVITLETCIPWTIISETLGNVNISRSGMDWWSDNATCQTGCALEKYFVLQ